MTDLKLQNIFMNTKEYVIINQYVFIQGKQVIYIQHTHTYIYYLSFRHNRITINNII